MAAVDLIRYDGDGRMLVYRHPNTGFNTAILIVREDQEAILLINGHIANLYGAGKYTIKSGNIPVFHDALSKGVLGEVAPNQCEVFIIVKNCALKLYWGTSTPMLLQDPQYHLPIRLRAHGSLTIRVENSVLLLQSLAEARVNLSREALEEHCRGMVVSKVKAHIAKYMTERQVSATSVSAHVEAISEGVMPLISNLLMRYGITADTFVIESIDAVNDESFQRICELMTSNPQIRNETDNMHCLHCHTTLLPSSRFCHVCGQAINGC